MRKSTPIQATQLPETSAQLHVIRRLAWIGALALAVACGSSKQAERRDPPEKAAAGAAKRVPAGPPPAREALLGEMCPSSVKDRPGVIPMVVRRVVWHDDPEEASRPIERGAARQFSVFGWDGRRAGLFSVAGATDIGLAAHVALGSYAGASPCDEPSRGDGAPATDAECVASQQSCGIALAVLEPAGGFTARPYEEDPDPTEFAVGGGCVARGKLLVDIDGDDVPEAFDANAFLEALRGPAEEVTAVSADGATCEPRFAVRGVVPAGDPRDWRGLDLLGVIDIDGDGRFELVLAYHYAGRRTWAVYSAPSTPARLELVGEAVPWGR